MRFLILLFIGITVIPLSASEGLKRVSFRAQGVPGASSSDVGSVAMREIVRTYLQQHPHVDIEPFVMPSLRGTNTMDFGPLMAISAGMPPHAIYVNFRQSSTYIQQGFLEPLEVLFARLNSDNERVRMTDEDGKWLEEPTEEEIQATLEEIRGRVFERIWPVVYRPRDLGKSNPHHVWALPTHYIVQALYYRKDLFLEAGLDPEKAPQNWSELLDYARKLTIPERNQYGMHLVPGHDIAWSVYFLLVSGGSRAMEQGEDGRWRASFDGRNTAESLYFLWRLVREPFVRDGRMIAGAAMISSAASLEWNRGRVGMFMGGLDEHLLASVNPQLIGIAPVPASPLGSRGGEINASMLGVFAGASAEQKLEVARYLWFITGEEAQRIRTRVFVEHGYGQFVNPDLLRRFGYDSYLRQVPQNWVEAHRIAMEEGVPEPYGDNTQNIYRFMSRPINQVLEMDFRGLSQEQAVARILPLLEETVADVNQHVLGQWDEAERAFRNRVAVAVLIGIATIFLWGSWHVWCYFSRMSAPSRKGSHWGKYLWGYLLVLPGLLLVLLWSYLPLMIGGFSIAFMDYRIVQESLWVGVENFATVLFDDRFWQALWRTFYYVALAIGLGFWPPILLAILLQEVPGNFSRYFFRVVFYLPSVLVGVVVMFLWMQLYNSGPTGILNQILMSLNGLDPVSATLLRWVFILVWLSFVAVLIWLPIRLEEMNRAFKIGLWIVGALLIGITLEPIVRAFAEGGYAGGMALLGGLFGGFEVQPLRWTQSPDMAMLCVIIPAVWAGAGPGCIIYLAALKSVPDELYEAAEIDGASHWHKVFYIVLPRLKYLIVIQFVAAVIAAFKGGEEMILAMTGGGPNDATAILSLEILFRTFVELNFGVGTAMAWIIGAMLIIFTAWQLKLLSRAEFRAAG